MMLRLADGGGVGAASGSLVFSMKGWSLRSPQEVRRRESEKAGRNRAKRVVMITAGEGAT
jgi:hypothetical protein